jgi:RHS repeat-associated protein
MQGAGGVGGLLAEKQGANTYYPTYDGNGNVSEYVTGNGAIAAHFEYDPFGNLTVDSENNAATFPYRFSTKPQDPTTGLYFYTYRWYDPLTGRWPSRDPIEERGGLNLYGFVRNNGLSLVDYLGLSDYPTTSVERCEGYLYIGHGVVGQPRKWNMNGGMCAIAGQVGCFPAENQPADPWEKYRSSMHERSGTPDSPQWPDLPMHNKELKDGIGGDVVGSGETHARAESSGEPADETHFETAIENAFNAIPEVIEKLCNGCCDNVTIILEVEDKEDVRSSVKIVTRKLGWKDLTPSKNITKYPCP